MDEIGTTGMIPFTYFGGVQKLVGSTFLRVDALAACDSGFEKWIHGKRYDNLIFQKAYWVDMMKLFKGPKILDVCDPDWLQSQLDIVDIGNLVHAITCSSEQLTNLMRGYFPDKIVEWVPDRLNFNLFPSPRLEHQGKAKLAIWFGFIHNAHETLEQLLPALKENKLKLRIIADKPYSKEDGILELKPEYLPYDQRWVYRQLKEGDILLNPRSQRAFYKYKSNNKSLIAWRLGLPVAVTEEEVKRFMDPEERNKEVKIKQLLVEKEYGIDKSAEQYRRILSTVRGLYF